MHSHRLLARLISALLFVICTTSRATIVTIDFEELAANDNGTSYTDPALISNGFVLDPGLVDGIGHYHLASPTEPFWFSNNGSQYMVVDYAGSSTTLNIYQPSGGVFGMRQLDLGEAMIESLYSVRHCITSPYNYQVAFTGYLEGGGTISRTVTLDGICDGMGPLADFETITFDGTWNRLTMLTFQQTVFSDTPESWLAIDNIVLRTVAEPSTFALLAVALTVLVQSRRREGQ